MSNSAKLGFTHADVGGIIADKWRFASISKTPSQTTTSPARPDRPSELTQIVSLANSICHKLAVGPTRKPDLDLNETESAKALGLGPASIERILLAVSEAVREEKVE